MYIVIGLAANKCDLIDSEQVPEEKAREFAKEIGAIFKLTSASTSIGIEELFVGVGCKFLDPNYKEEGNKIKFYSLFPITYSEQIPYILNFEVAKNSLITNMKGLGFKTMIACEKDEISGINYYLNGLQMVNNPDISFICLNSYVLPALSP